MDIDRSMVDSKRLITCVFWLTGKPMNVFKPRLDSPSTLESDLIFESASTELCHSVAASSGINLRASTSDVLAPTAANSAKRSTRVKDQVLASSPSALVVGLLIRWHFSAASCLAVSLAFKLSRAPSVTDDDIASLPPLQPYSSLRPKASLEPKWLRKDDIPYMKCKIKAMFEITPVY